MGISGSVCCVLGFFNDGPLVKVFLLSLSLRNSLHQEGGGNNIVYIPATFSSPAILIPSHSSKLKRFVLHRVTNPEEARDQTDRHRCTQYLHRWHPRCELYYLQYNYCCALTPKQCIARRRTIPPHV